MKRKVTQITDNRLQITDADTEPPPPKNNYLLFTQEIGLLTPSIADFIDLAEKELTEEWVHDAILEASSHNARTVAYIKKILDTWKKNGRKSTNPQRTESEPKTEARQDENGDYIRDKDGRVILFEVKL
jgi:DnaD/phage-associated family protein